MHAVFGAGAKVTDFMCVFVGTGVGGAYLRDGKLLRGATGSAGEIGHLIVDSGGRHCGCGGRGSEVVKALTRYEATLHSSTADLMCFRCWYRFGSLLFRDDMVAERR